MAQFDLENFTNIDSEPFVGQWAGEDYVIQPGKTRPFPVFLVNHFCKHLADKMLMREDKYHLEIERENLVKKMRTGEIVVPKSEEIELTEGEKVKAEVVKTQKEVEEKSKDNKKK